MVTYHDLLFSEASILRVPPLLHFLLSLLKFLFVSLPLFVDKLLSLMDHTNLINLLDMGKVGSYWAQG